MDVFDTLTTFNKKSSQVVVFPSRGIPNKKEISCKIVIWHLFLFQKSSYKVNQMLMISRYRMSLIFLREAK